MNMLSDAPTSFRGERKKRTKVTPTAFKREKGIHAQQKGISKQSTFFLVQGNSMLAGLLIVWQRLCIVQLP